MRCRRGCVRRSSPAAIGTSVPSARWWRPGFVAASSPRPSRLSPPAPSLARSIGPSSGFVPMAPCPAPRLPRCWRITRSEDWRTAVEKTQIALTVNGEPHDVAFDPYKTLLEVLREDLNLTGTKHGCELGECGACAVLLDGRPVLSCLVLGLECSGRAVVTVEGLATDGRLHRVQETFADLGAAQCGYCTPGFLVTAKALLDRTPHPTRDQIREALAGNLCRCTGYQQIVEAVEAAVLRS